MHQDDLAGRLVASVSMKSGLEGRNNDSAVSPTSSISRLNEVRPRRPEQLEPCTGQEYALAYRLNEVRPRRPEQSSPIAYRLSASIGLNEVRPRRPEQSLRWFNDAIAGAWSQ